MRKNKSVPEKAKRILQIFSFAFLLIAFRVWHLEVVQREEKQKMAEQPKRRAIVEKANRGFVCDRFQIPLAVNKICYNAAIYYNQISQFPAVAWKDDGSGKKIRHMPRREYIRQLSEKLGALLKLDPLRIEDLIHSKASLFPHVPFIIKSGLAEEEHYKLALLEKDWLGVHAEIGSERFYPRGKAGAEVIGSMGSISSKEYFAIADEIISLQTIIESWEQAQGYELPEGFSSFEAVVARCQELKEKAYTLQDLIGKSGVEGKFEAQLRGFYGKKIYEVDQKGKFLKELAGGRQAIPGQQLSLTLSIELQEFAEALLAEHEAVREGKSLGYDPKTKERRVLKQPWIKGGSIVALDPKTGEVLALASTPRFDPNDFIPSSNAAIQERKQRNICRWLENERLIGHLWDGRQDLIRERFSAKKGFSEDAQPLTWEFFLGSILPPNGPLRTFFQRVDDVKMAVQAQEDYEAALYHGSKESEEAKRLDDLLRPLAASDRLLAIDLCRLVAHAPAFTDESLKLLGPMKLSSYRALNQKICRLEAELKRTELLLFRKNEFQAWRGANQKDYLAEMRIGEKANKRSPRPYIDYLDRKEDELFQLYWSEHRLDRLAAAIKEDPLFKTLSQEEAKGVLHTFRSFADLQRPLLGSYKRIRKKQGEQLEKHLAASFYPIGGFGFSRSYAFQAAAPQGSIFKLVTAYAGLLQTKGENPLTIIDEIRGGPKMNVASSIAGVPYPRMYKGGRLPKSHSPNIGKIDLLGALEQTSNPYFALVAGDILKDPEDLNAAARLFGFGAPTHIDLPGEGRGNLPSDLRGNRTGLYSTAIGQHTLLVTPLQTAVMLGAIANGGEVLRPILAKEMSGLAPDRGSLNGFEQQMFAKEELHALGIFFPLFTAAYKRSETEVALPRKTEVLRSINLPASIRSQILEGMDRVVWGSKGTARPSAMRNSALLAQYLSLRHQMVGKTGTAEILFNPNINPSSAPFMYKHVWFAGISFEENSRVLWDHPELTVVVYFRYGDRGGEAAPLASQMIHKWREIKKKHELKRQNVCTQSDAGIGTA